MTIVDEPLVLGPHTFTSRLFLGTGKYPDMESMVAALDVSGTQCVTVAVRRMEMGAPAGKTLLDYLPTDRYTLLPNTAGCFDAEHAVRMGIVLGVLGVCVVLISVAMVLGQKRCSKEDEQGGKQGLK